MDCQLLRQKFVKYENKNTGVTAVFKTKRELNAKMNYFFFLETPVFMVSLLRLFDELLT